MIIEPSPTPEKRVAIQKMFGRIAQNYDLLNKIISIGQDGKWRDALVRIIDPERNQIYLDIGCGTGDLAEGIVKKQPEAVVVAADFSSQMVRVGKTKSCNERILWIVADAQALPFETSTFDGVVSGYLLRNVSDQKLTLREQYRVMRDEARVAALDTTPPVKNWQYPFILAYFYFVIPILGLILAGDLQAYSYLPQSTRLHTSADRLVEIFKETGFIGTGFTKMMFGTMVIHFGKKPAIDL